MSLIESVVATAKSFVGQKETPGNNSGFADPKFQKQMQKSGFARGMSWCALLCETVFRVALEEAKRPALWNKLEPLFSPGAVDTLNRFHRAGYTVKQTPSVGDLVVWRHGPGPNGHIGIVVGVGTPGSKMFTTVEGNTSGKTFDRNGDSVFLKNRQYGIPISNRPGSFNLLGFVSPVST